MMYLALCTSVPKLVDSTFKPFYRLKSGLPEGCFIPYMYNSFWVMRLIGNRKLDHDAPGGGISCGPHTDYSFLIILNTDNIAGVLRVQIKGGYW